MTTLPSKLGILAGGGLLPERLVRFCDDHDIQIFIVGFENETPSELLAGRDHMITRIGQSGGILKALRERDIHDLVLIGSIKRPDLKSLRPDWPTALFFGKILMKSLGDDGLLRAARTALEKEGFRLHGIHELMDHLLVREGVLGNVHPNAEQNNDIQIGMKAAKHIGVRDIGQSVIVHDAEILGVEDQNGTDDLIRRCATKGAILVKSSKPQQDRKLDLPTIGSNTVRLCAELGYAGIAIEAGSTLIADEDIARQLADHAGLFIAGIKNQQIAIIAGEPSGDFLGGQLAQALKKANPAILLSGVGGDHMKTQGIESLFPYEDLAVMGIAEVLPRLPTILKRIRQTADFIKETRPDIVVTIDSPDFCLRVVKALRQDMVHPPKFVHYVAPTVWAWREGRAEKMAATVDGLICLFDFEPPYFEKHGLKAISAGHPLVESGALQADGVSFREECGIARSEKIIGILFGSRKGELKRVGKSLRDSAFLLAEKMGSYPHIVAPTLPHLKDEVFDLLKDYPGPIHIVTGAEEKWSAFASFDIALAVSGTVGLELAAMKVPHVIAYKASPLTVALVRRLIKVKFAHLANIMAGREIVPEFLQERCEPELIAQAAYDIWQSPSGQIADFEGVRFQIGADQKQTPSEKAAAFVLSYMS